MEINVEKIEKWLKTICPKMAKENDGTVYSIAVGDFDTEDKHVFIDAVLEWEDGFEPSSDKYVDDKGYGMSVSLKERSTGDMVSDSCSICDDFDKISKWLFDEYLKIKRSYKYAMKSVKKQLGLSECDQKAVAESIAQHHDFRLDICTCGAAFEDDPSYELARILKTLAKGLEDGHLINGNILDVNGNICGHVERSFGESKTNPETNYEKWKTEHKEWISKIEQILSTAFEGKAKFATETADGNLIEIDIESWLKEPIYWDLEEKILKETGVATNVEWNKYNDHGEMDDDGDTISVWINTIIDPE